jgi:hypothetical protein
MRSQDERGPPAAQLAEISSANWTTPRDLQEQLRRLWKRGELLRSLTGGDRAFPLRLTLKGPTSADLAGRFEAVRAWIAGLVAFGQIRIEWREFTHRVLGLQRVPQSVWVDTLDTALEAIGKRAEAARFNDLLALTRSRQPRLLEWLARRPLQALELAESWENLLAVVDWLAAHPNPGIYLRQVDIPGLHSKFIEDHRGVLTEILDLSLAPPVIETDRAGTVKFAARYGFLDKPTRIRFRVLDARIALLPGPSMPDVTLDADSFAKLTAPIRRVFITENETNFLAFPPATQSIVIFGAGYGWNALARAKWLSQCTLFYWGDIDTHGFAILDQLREHFDHVESFLMDRATLIAHERVWGKEADQVVRDLPRLTETERALFDELRDNRIRKNLRLEQEHLGFEWVKAALKSEFTESG